MAALILSAGLGLLNGSWLRPLLDGMPELSARAGVGTRMHAEQRTELG